MTATLYWKGKKHAYIGAKAGVQGLGTPISKKVLAVNPDQSTKYISRKEAEARVREGKAHWDDIVKRQRIYCVRGKVTGNIRDHWRIMPSGGGICVWQMVSTVLLLAMLSNINPRFFPGFHHLQNMPQPVWVTNVRA